MATTTSRAKPVMRRVRDVWAMIAVALTILAGGVTPVMGQTGSTPVPAENQEPAASDAPAASNPGANLSASPDSPPALAQGLIYLTGEDVVWQVREVVLPSPAAAGPVTGSARVTYQVSGESIIRNDVTGKRSRLEVGESYFMSAGDPYTSMAADGAQSTVWVFEIANDDQVGEGAFYLSPGIGGIAEGVYDFEFLRTTLAPGDSTGYMSTGGPFLIMVESGQISVSDGGGGAALSAGEGRIVEQNATIDSNGDGQAVYTVTAIGPQVSDSTAAAPMAPAAAAPSEDTSSISSALAPESQQEPAPAPAQSSDPAVPGIDPADLFTGVLSGSSTTPGSAPQPAPQQGGEYVTSITVWAVAPISLTVIADGVTMFDGYLEAGQSTGWVTGSVFEVYTSSGVSSEFTNSCSDVPFLMGYEEGDAYYVLTASASSCAPVE